MHLCSWRASFPVSYPAFCTTCVEASNQELQIIKRGCTFVLDEKRTREVQLTQGVKDEVTTRRYCRAAVLGEHIARGR
jgi:hypothetical protein